MKNKKIYKYPLTFEKVRKFEIKTIEGRKLYVKSDLYATKQYLSSHFYKHICNLI